MGALTVQTTHRVTGDKVRLCCAVGLGTRNKTDVFTVSSMYDAQAGHLCAGSLVDLLSLGSAGPRSTWHTGPVSTFWTWIPPAGGEVLHSRAVEVADLLEACLGRG